jgi:hypothetical protein
MSSNVLRQASQNTFAAGVAMQNPTLDALVVRNTHFMASIMVKHVI